MWVGRILCVFTKFRLILSRKWKKHMFAPLLFLEKNKVHSMLRLLNVFFNNRLLRTARALISKPRTPDPSFSTSLRGTRRKHPSLAGWGVLCVFTFSVFSPFSGVPPPEKHPPTTTPFFGGFWGGVRKRPFFRPLKKPPPHHTPYFRGGVWKGVFFHPPETRRKQRSKRGPPPRKKQGAVLNRSALEKSAQPWKNRICGHFNNKVILFTFAK